MITPNDLTKESKGFSLKGYKAWTVGHWLKGWCVLLPLTGSDSRGKATVLWSSGLELSGFGSRRLF